MTTEDLIEELIQRAYKSYKAKSRGSIEASRLDQKLPVVVYGVEFTCWREYVCYKVCEYLKDKCPEAKVDLYLDGNNSTISIVLSDNEQQILNQKINTLMKSWA